MYVPHGSVMKAMARPAAGTERYGTFSLMPLASSCFDERFEVLHFESDVIDGASACADGPLRRSEVHRQAGQRGADEGGGIGRGAGGGAERLHVPGLHLLLRTGEVHVMRHDRRRLCLHFNELDLHVVRRHRVGDAGHGPAFDDADVVLDLNVGGCFGGGDDAESRRP